MLEKVVIFNALTGETCIEERNVEPVVDEIQTIDVPTLEERVEQIEGVNAIQDELINVSLLATDEVFCMLEPLLSSVNIIDVKGVSRMVDMYVVMVQRGLKTIEDVPLRYREEVKRILEALEK